jgi:hypothetical protein
MAQEASEHEASYFQDPQEAVFCLARKGYVAFDLNWRAFAALGLPSLMAADYCIVEIIIHDSLQKGCDEVRSRHSTFVGLLL